MSEDVDTTGEDDDTMGDEEDNMYKRLVARAAEELRAGAVNLNCCCAGQ